MTGLRAWYNRHRPPGFFIVYFTAAIVASTIAQIIWNHR